VLEDDIRSHTHTVHDSDSFKSLTLSYFMASCNCRSDGVYLLGEWLDKQPGIIDEDGQIPLETINKLLQTSKPVIDPELFGFETLEALFR